MGKVSIAVNELNDKLEAVIEVDDSQEEFSQEDLEIMESVACILNEIVHRN